MKKNVSIALVQMESIFGRVEENLEKMWHFAREAAGRGAEITCFPELCVHGYRREEIHRVAEPVPGHSSRILAAMARETGTVILAGLAEKTGGGKPYNTHVIAYPHGKIASYRKTHLGKSELPYFSPADSFPLYSAPGTKFGIQICWEMHFPEVSTILSLKGAEVIFAPHASPTIVGDRREIWLRYMAARAYDNSVYVATCNLVGSGGEKQSFCGGAMVLDPKGNVVAEDFSGREGVLVTSLDAGFINTIRYRDTGSMRHSFFLASRRPELYKELVMVKKNQPEKQEFFK